jgi:hypothetical protein
VHCAASTDSLGKLSLGALQLHSAATETRGELAVLRHRLVVLWP